MLYLSIYYLPVQNSVETGKFCGSAQNSAIRGKLWSLPIRSLSAQKQSQSSN